MSKQSEALRGWHQFRVQGRLNIRHHAQDTEINQDTAPPAPLMIDAGTKKRSNKVCLNAFS